MNRPRPRTFDLQPLSASAGDIERQPGRHAHQRALSHVKRLLHAVGDPQRGKVLLFDDFAG
tara:strand:- start:3564 stop:3746 length:183 start_codon:yes stop_codon:yes gene_type:complete